MCPPSDGWLCGVYTEVQESEPRKPRKTRLSVDLVLDLAKPGGRPMICPANQMPVIHDSAW